ncbi:hypothetical protein LCGC14_2443130, partial [marine sediment metagenome]
NTCENTNLATDYRFFDVPLTQPPFSGPPDMLGFPFSERESYEKEAF